MQILKLDGNTVDIIACPPEDIRKGNYILLKDEGANAGLIVQVVNTGYANIPGLLEELLRETSTQKLDGVDMDLLGVKSFVDTIKDAKIFHCKLRRSVFNGRLSDDISWTPNRSSTVLRRLSGKEVMKLIKPTKGPAIHLGTLADGSDVFIPVYGLDGKLNIITGRKGTGKSHLSKLLLLGLIEHGALCLVLDVNGEYSGLGEAERGIKKPSRSVWVLSPGRNFKTTLAYAGLDVFLDVVSAALELPPNSAWEVRRIWYSLARENMLNLRKLGEAINAVPNSYVRDALLRRYESLICSGLFTDDPKEATTLEEWLDKCRGGGAVVINLRGLSSGIRQIVVEFVLGKLRRLLEQWYLPAIFLFAEEAHLYIRETYWDDLVTLMRHLGIFTTFITNQPDSIDEGIYRQADNIFLFNFTNENDLAAISRATMVDVETVTAIARELPPRHCLALGRVVNDFPVIVHVAAIEARTMGETRRFFPMNPPEEPEELFIC
jgi:DNA helicase HerA-like ATPase